MKYTIIGSGKIGSALVRAFARQNIKVGIANTRGPASLADLTKELGANVVPQSLRDQREQWNGKIIVDAMNTFDTRPEELRGRLSSELVSEAFVGVRLAKAFNHLPAEQLGASPSLPFQRQAIFLSSNHTDASAAVAALARELGFAPVELGRLDQGGVPLPCWRTTWRSLVSESRE